MKQIRRSVFETNSSSTHSITMCSSEEYDKWKNNEMLYDRQNNELVDVHSIIVNEYDEDLYSYKRWYESWDLEHFTKTYTTKSGEKVVAFGEFGYDG